MLIRWSVVTLVLTCGFSFGWVQFWPHWQEPATTVALAGENPTLLGQPEAQVLIRGAVQKPGLYRLPKTAIVYDLVQLAGGLKPEANADVKLLTQTVPNGGEVEIPEHQAPSISSPTSPPPASVQPMAAPLHSTSPPSNPSSPTLNLNTCNAQDLQKVPGIGPKLAERIITARQEKGGFKSVSDLRQVKGIGEKRFEKMKGYFQ